ncbi:MAG: acylneuraminate cytidylyltransferase family protein [Leptospiraceae bacterium]|nr:acylneuraminate cytidylyltransferase family protein [Leptospiraceae bacterium]
MINNKKVLCIVPARANSKGLPGKNIKNLCGKPLIAWPIETAKNSKYIDKVICSTDGEEIAKIAEKHGAEIPFIRPKELATDTSPSYEFILHALNFLKDLNQKYDYFILLEPTSPLTSTEDVDKAIEMLENNRNIADSIVGISKSESTNPIFAVKSNNEGLISSWDEKEITNSIRRQDIPESYFKDGSLYISDTQIYLNLKKFYHDRTLGYKTKKWQSLEIDDIIDFICIESIVKNLDLINKTFSS